VLGKLARSLVIAALVLVPLGCGKEKDEPPAVEVLPAPSNGGPIAVKFLEFTGEGERGMKVLLYNTGDKTAVGYHLLFRYYDANDKLLRVKVGTPFEDDTAFTSMSGKAYKCEPKQNATLEVDGMLADVPADAVRAEIVASMVHTVKDDGLTVEDWWKQENWSEWPSP
jgi:hypothetical protein